MFDAETGFFHLVFANMEDSFFTSSCIRTDFLSYLRLRLIEDGFRYLCFVGRTSIGRQNDYQLIMTGGLTESMIREAPEKKGLFRKHARSDRDQKDAWEAGDSGKKNIAEVNSSSLRGYLTDFLGKMGTQTDCAIVCPLDIFSYCCEDDAFVKDLVVRRKAPNHNIMILTGSVNAADHDSLFNRLAVADDRSSSSIFQNADVFPCIKNYIRNSRNRDGVSSLPKLIFTYDLLKKAFGERMHVLNELRFESVCSLVRYIILRNGIWMPMRYPSDCYAALVCAWYNNELFREKYPFLELPDTPFRVYNDIAGAIADPRFFTAADRILDSESAHDDKDMAQSIADYWFTDSGETGIYYDEKTAADRLPEVRSALATYRRSLRGHESILNSSELHDLDIIARHFSRPSYPQYDTAMPHDLFARYKARIQELYKSLSKGGWTCWDETAMRLMFVLFKRCYEHTLETTQDINNYCGQMEFEKCIETVEFCMRNSARYPNDVTTARFVCTRAERVLCCKDPEAVRIYKATEASKI